MYIDRGRLKTRAKSLISTAKPNPIPVGLVYLAISVVFSLLSSRLLGANLSETDLQQILTHIQNGNYDYAGSYLSEYAPPATSYFMDAALQLVLSIVSVGFIIYLLNTIRGAGACYGNLLDGFGIFWKIIVLNILEGLFIFLWSLLLIVPGIIAAYRYRMATYILVDHPEMSAIECIRESKRMMKGHKGELFMLDLSFIGWQLLADIPMVGWAVSIWTTPYFGMTYALYYETLSGHETRREDTWNDPRDFDGYRY